MSGQVQLYGSLELLDLLLPGPPGMLEVMGTMQMTMQMTMLMLMRMTELIVGM
jgi:hypothetical protein